MGNETEILRHIADSLDAMAMAWVVTAVFVFFIFLVLLLSIGKR